MATAHFANAGLLQYEYSVNACDIIFRGFIGTGGYSNLNLLVKVRYQTAFNTPLRTDRLVYRAVAVSGWNGRQL